jgi:F-type H+-transporting ATPase subunit a
MAEHAHHSPSDHVNDWEGLWPLFENASIPLGKFTVFGFEFHITKFMILELIAAVLICAIFIPLARKVQRGGIPRGAWWNGFEGLLTFIRDDVAHPNLHEDTDKYVPLLWTMFIFILFCNLLGLVPMLGSPTASLWMTVGLAIFSLLAFHVAPILKMGVFHYLHSMWPGVEKQLPFAFGVGWLLGVVISLFIFLIEFGGTFIKSGVLALRLFVNMSAGHLILASILLVGINIGLQEGITLTSSVASVISILGVIALSLLELFVAFLQAYVFTFLTALFLGMALHPSH